MSAHVLLNLLNEFWEKDEMRGFAEHLINFPQRFYLSYDTKITFNSRFSHHHVNILPLENKTF